MLPRATDGCFALDRGPEGLRFVLDDGLEWPGEAEDDCDCDRDRDCDCDCDRDGEAPATWPEFFFRGRIGRYGLCPASLAFFSLSLRRRCFQYSRMA